MTAARCPRGGPVRRRIARNIFRPPAGLAEMLRGRFFGRRRRRSPCLVFDRARGDRRRDGPERRGQVDAGPDPRGPAAAARWDGARLRGRRRDAADRRVPAPGRVRRRRRAQLLLPGVGPANLHYFAALHGLPARVARRGPAGCWRSVGLAEAAHRPYRDYSRGMRQRRHWRAGCSPIRDGAAAGRAELGLDPRGARDMRVFLRDEVIRKLGRTGDRLQQRSAGGARARRPVLFLEAGRLHGDGRPIGSKRSLVCESPLPLVRAVHVGLHSARVLRARRLPHRPRLPAAEASRLRSGRWCSCRASLVPPPIVTLRATGGTISASWSSGPAPPIFSRSASPARPAHPHWRI